MGLGFRGLNRHARPLARNLTQAVIAFALAVSPGAIGTLGTAGAIPWIWINPGVEDFFDSKFTDGMPVLAKDFWQSSVEGPRMLPSMYASPGQRVHVPA